MSLNKDAIIFDPADLAESDSVGAYLRSADGTLLTHTTNGAKEALDVNIAEFTSAGVKVIDSDGDELAIEADGSINVNASFSGPIKFRNASSVVVDVEEDTAPLPVKLQSTAGDINITAGDLNVQLDHTGATFDSVRIGDGTDLLGISGNGEATVVDRANDAVATASTTIAATATPVVASALSERKYVEIQNLSGKKVFLGGSGVTAGTGIEIKRGNSWSGSVGPGVVLHAITESGTSDIRVLELA
jgi:hypothetical protein